MNDTAQDTITKNNQIDLLQEVLSLTEEEYKQAGNASSIQSVPTEVWGHRRGALWSEFAHPFHLLIHTKVSFAHHKTLGNPTPRGSEVPPRWMKP